MENVRNREETLSIEKANCILQPCNQRENVGENFNRFQQLNISESIITFVHLQRQIFLSSPLPTPELMPYSFFHATHIVVTSIEKIQLI